MGPASADLNGVSGAVCPNELSEAFGRPSDSITRPARVRAAPRRPCHAMPRPISIATSIARIAIATSTTTPITPMHRRDRIAVRDNIYSARMNN